MTECKVSKEIKCRRCGKQGHMQVAYWKEYEKPAGAKFAGKGRLS